MKVIPQRSPIFKQQTTLAPSAASEADVDIDMRKIRSNPVTTTPEVTATVQQAEPTPSHSSSAQEQDEEPYHPSEEMNSHLLQLLSTAEARVNRDVDNVQSPSPGKHNQRMTRSRGIKLAWNPVMNASQTLVVSSSEENPE